MDHSFCVILSTTDSPAEADSLAEMLVTSKLAACVQIIPITSIYTWEEVLNKDSEYLMLIKTRAELYPKVEAAILEHHSYETPEIIQLPVASGSSGYLSWIDDSLK